MIAKPCVKCGSTERYANGDCRPCAIVRNTAYKSERREKLAAQSRDYYHAHKKELAKTSAEWRKKNAAYLAMKGAEYRAANPERLAAHKRKHYEKNLEKVRARSKQWVIDNRARHQERERQYHINNPEVRVNAKAKRRSLIGIDKLPYGTIPALFKKQNGLCACCGVVLVKYHVDHIMPLKLGGRHIPENLQLLLPSCNHKKSAKHPDVWRAELAAQNPQITSTGSYSSESSLSA